VRPSILKLHSYEYVSDLANGSACLALGYSGDIFQAIGRAREAGNNIHIAYSIPIEGALLWVDGFVIPMNASDLEEAHQFLNFMLRPEIVAETTNRLGYANGNRASLPLIDDAIKSDPTVYPPASARKRFYTVSVPTHDYDRLRLRAWTRIKTGHGSDKWR
jgi:putrescine transport system substrate-binding protein